MPSVLRAYPGGFTERRRHLGDQVMAHMLAGRLDRDLAAGCAPESGLLLAERARELVAPGTRRALARDWEHLLQVAAGRVPRTPVPVLLCRRRVLAAESDVRALIASLLRPGPVPARGVAAASLLLTDGAGPLHDPRHPTPLPAAVHAVIRQLDPALSLF
jgi:hypothetical protein